MKADDFEKLFARHKPMRGDRWIALWLLIGAMFWLCLWAVLS